MLNILKITRKNSNRHLNTGVVFLTAFLLLAGLLCWDTPSHAQSYKKYALFRQPSIRSTPSTPTQRPETHDRKYQLFLDSIKKTNPQKYQAHYTTYKRQKEIKRTVNKFNAGAISFYQAKQLLYPLIEQQIAQELKLINVRILQTQKKLSEDQQKSKRLRLKGYCSQKEISMLKKEIAEKTILLKELRQIRNAPQKLINGWVNFLLGKNKEDLARLLRITYPNQAR